MILNIYKLNIITMRVGFFKSPIQQINIQLKQHTTFENHCSSILSLIYIYFVHYTKSFKNISVEIIYLTCLSKLD